MLSRMVLTVAATLALAAPSSVGAAGLLALGDSFSSGQGAGLYDPRTTGHGNTCYRSAGAWPQLLANSLALIRLPSLACNGAVTAQVLYSDHRGEFERRTSQLTRISGDPDLITITIGGNDVGFAEVLRYCILGSCDRHYNKPSGDVLDGRISKVANVLPGLYRRIRARAPRARILVVGYPRIFPLNVPGGEVRNCAAWELISPREVAYLNEKASSLNGAIDRAASQAGVDFVDISDAFKGRELRCKGDSYVNPLQRRWGIPPYRPSSFHPNAWGYVRLAEVVARQMRSFPFGAWR
jgi:lysophospholipase L1-like esterase